MKEKESRLISNNLGISKKLLSTTTSESSIGISKWEIWFFEAMMQAELREIKAQC